MKRIKLNEVFKIKESNATLENVVLDVVEDWVEKYKLPVEMVEDITEFSIEMIETIRSGTEPTHSYSPTGSITSNIDEWVVELRTELIRFFADSNSSKGQRKDVKNLDAEDLAYRLIIAVEDAEDPDEPGSMFDDPTA